MISLKLYDVLIAGKKLRLFLLDSDNVFHVNGDLQIDEKQGGCQPLFLGCDVLDSVSGWNKNRSRIHARFCQQGYATKLQLSGCRIEGLPKGDEAYFYSVHGLFKVAFQYDNVGFQRHCLQHLTDIWVRVCRGDRPPTLDVAYTVSSQNLVFSRCCSPNARGQENSSSLRALHQEVLIAPNSSSSSVGHQKSIANSSSSSVPNKENLTNSSSSVASHQQTNLTSSSSSNVSHKENLTNSSTSVASSSSVGHQKSIANSSSSSVPSKENLTNSSSSVASHQQTNLTSSSSSRVSHKENLTNSSTSVASHHQEHLTQSSSSIACHQQGNLSESSSSSVPNQEKLPHSSSPDRSQAITLNNSLSSKTPDQNNHTVIPASVNQQRNPQNVSSTNNSFSDQIQAPGSHVVSSFSEIETQTESAARISSVEVKDSWSSSACSPAMSPPSAFSTHTDRSLHTTHTDLSLQSPCPSCGRETKISRKRKNVSPPILPPSKQLRMAKSTGNQSECEKDAFQKLDITTEVELQSVTDLLKKDNQYASKHERYVCILRPKSNAQLGSQEEFDQRRVFPQQEDSLAQQQDSLPQQEDNLPHQENNLPEQELISPQQGSFSQQKDNLPQKEDNLPQQEDNLSKQENNLLEKEDNLPRQGHSFHHEINNMPQQQDILPQHQDSLLQQKDNLPEKEDKFAHQEDSLSQQEDNYSQQEVCFPQQDNISHQKVDNLPQHEASISPQKEDKMSQQEASLSQQNDNFPQQEELLVQRDNNLPQQEDYLPQQQDNLPQKESIFFQQEDNSLQHEDSSLEKTASCISRLLVFYDMQTERSRFLVCPEKNTADRGTTRLDHTTHFPGTTTEVGQSETDGLPWESSAPHEKQRSSFLVCLEENKAGGRTAVLNHTTRIPGTTTESGQPESVRTFWEASAAQEKQMQEHNHTSDGSASDAGADRGTARPDNTTCIPGTIKEVGQPETVIMSLESSAPQEKQMQEHEHTSDESASDAGADRGTARPDNTTCIPGTTPEVGQPETIRTPWETSAAQEKQTQEHSHTSDGLVSDDVASYLLKWTEEATDIRQLLSARLARNTQGGDNRESPSAAASYQTYEDLKNQWDLVSLALDFLSVNAASAKSPAVVSVVTEVLSLVSGAVEDSAGFGPAFQDWPVSSSPCKLSALTAFGHWLGKEFRRYEPVISRRVTCFKEEHINNIDNLPHATEVIGHLFPPCMLTLCASWMGLADPHGSQPDETDHSYHYNSHHYDGSSRQNQSGGAAVAEEEEEEEEVEEISRRRENRNVYPVLQLVLELLNGALVSGMAHVVYCRLRHAY